MGITPIRTDVRRRLLICIGLDSIDLQDQNAPSAKDHTRQPAHPAPLGVGPPAPHQAETLRELAVEAAEENHRSPRVSKEWTNGDVQQLQQYGDELAGVSAKLNGANLQKQDDLAVAQNGGLTGLTAEDAEMADAEGDDGMDDDMMDQISSSPSIDDGGYSLPHLWPQRSDSLRGTPNRSPSFSQACIESSSPFVETPDHFPLRLPSEQLDKDEVQGYHHRHLLGEYPDRTGETELDYDEESRDEIDPVPNDSLQSFLEQYDQHGQYDQCYDLDHFTDETFACHMSGLSRLSKNESRAYSRMQSTSRTEAYEVAQRGASKDPENEETPEIPDETTEGNINDDTLTIPYESSEDEDDDYDIPYFTESRFVDSGWGGECLQETEDIDFEFVYALHTFVATVEGQANATKGDTMVLLDDSNSYWWLVRVVKDSSIGELTSKKTDPDCSLIAVVGYLPAEHIETPTERLARLNKRRNIDVRVASHRTKFKANLRSLRQPCLVTKLRNLKIP